MPLHEWTPKRRRNEQGEIEEYQKDLRTWLFEEESFVPLALFQDGKAYSIVTDHLGTPVEAYNEQGEEVWYRRLDMNGKVIEERSMNYTSYKDYVRIPFLFQGQYYDEEVKLAYNRFRYYDPELGRYISEDPIGLTGGFALYAYVEDVNGWVDLLGLKPSIIFTDSKGLSLLVKNQQDLSHMTTAQLKYMQKHGVAGTTTGGLKKGREKIILHHQKQNPLGPIIEMPMSKHIQNLGNKNMHPLGNQKGKEVGGGELRLDFNSWRKEYWKHRASVELEARKKKGTYT